MHTRCTGGLALALSLVGYLRQKTLARPQLTSAAASGAAAAATT
ncbi:hypothetical protein ACFRAO_34335 [Streptomyces sp. NPDC056656]